MKNKFRLSNEEVEGLHRRPLYNELIGMLDKPLITSYPDRKAITLRNSNWLQQLDGDDHEALKQLNHNMLKDQEKQNLLKHYAMATGVPLQEVKSMHTPAAKEPEYHNMAAGDDEDEPMEQDHEQYRSHPSLTSLEPRYGQMFDPHVDTRNEEVYKVAEKHPRRSKTKNTIGKKTGYLGNTSTTPIADDSYDDEIEKVSKQEVKDADIEAAQKAAKKSAFNQLAQFKLANSKNRC